MARKFINREDAKGLDAKKEVEAEDEWAHLAGGEDSGIESKIEKKIEAADAADVGDRNITFGNQQQVGQKTKFETVREEARNAMDAAGNTGQYIRFVNRHIDNQRMEIDKIKKIKERFDHEIDLLQSNRHKIDTLNSNFSSKPNVKDITESLHQLLLEKGITKSKLDNLKNEIGEIEEELQQQENQIEEVSEEIKNKKLITEDENKKEKMKEDLGALMKKYGVANLSDLEKFMK